MALAFKANYLLRSNPNYSSFESMCSEISDSYSSVHFVCIYRPTGHLANLCEDFQDLLESLATNQLVLYILGDFNIH